MKLLLIEDDKGLVRLLPGILLEINPDLEKVECCETVEDAKKSVEKCAWDLILLDYDLPDGTGVDVIRKIQSSINKNTPVISITGNPIGNHFKYRLSSFRV